VQYGPVAAVVILQINKFFFAKGGSERYLFALSDALAGRGHEVAHFAMQHPRNLPSPYGRHFAPNRDYTGSGFLRSLGAAREFVRSGAAARALRALLDDVRPDVAHLHNIYHQLTPSIVEVLARHEVPMVMTLHDYKLVCPSYALFARGRYCYRCRNGHFANALAQRCGGTRARSTLLMVEAYWQKWTRVYDRVDRFIAPSEFMRATMLEAGMRPERVHYVPPFAPGRDDDGTAGNGAGAWPERFVAYAGRLSAEKGVGVLLEAIARLPDVPLVVFGEGPEEGRLAAVTRERALGRVHFAGHVSHADLARAMPRCVAIAVPTLSPENAPLVVLEAASAGVPVIVSNMGGLPELARELDGRVVPAHDAGALAAAIREVWSDPGAARERAAAAWARARGRFDHERHVDAVLAIYRDVAA